MKSLTKNQKEILAALTDEFNAANAIVPTTPLSEALATIQAIIDTKKASEAAEVLRLELREIRRIDFLSQIITLIKPIADHFEININELVRENCSTIFEFTIERKDNPNFSHYLKIEATYESDGLYLSVSDENNYGRIYSEVSEAYNEFIKWVAKVTE